MSEEIEYIDPELNEFERQLKSRLTVKKEDEKNLSFLKEFLSQKRNQINFIEVDNSINIQIINNPPEIHKSSNKILPIILILTALIAIAAIFYFLQEPPAKPILKATYHIAYFEDIDIVDRLSKELNLTENEYAKFIFYKPTGEEAILVRKDSLSVQTKFEEVVFNKLSYIFNNTINNFLKDTSSVKNLVILGKMPKAPQSLKNDTTKHSFINENQFKKIKELNDKVDIIIFENKIISEENQELLNALDSFEIKYIKRKL